MSRYEKNIALQPGLVRGVLAQPEPEWAAGLRRGRVYFVGIGTSYFAARIGEWLWRRHVGPEAHAVGSFDFVRSPQPVKKGDGVIVLSHSGSKSFSQQAADLAFESGAVTVGVTCLGSPWRERLTHRLETCEREDTGAFTKSLTTALAWIAKLCGSRKLLDDLNRASGRLEGGPAFPGLELDTDLILVGDGPREWVAREIALKAQEGATVRARAFGLEEFLHGPRVSAGPGSLVVGFSGEAEPRWKDLRDFLSLIEVPFHEVPADPALGEGGWLPQLYWGQRFVADACRRLGVDPDSLRTDDPKYKEARLRLKL